MTICPSTGLQNGLIDSPSVTFTWHLLGSLALVRGVSEAVALAMDALADAAAVTLLGTVEFELVALDAPVIVAAAGPVGAMIVFSPVASDVSSGASAVAETTSNASRWSAKQRMKVVSIN